MDRQAPPKPSLRVTAALIFIVLAFASLGHAQTHNHDPNAPFVTVFFQGFTPEKTPLKGPIIWDIAHENGTKLLQNTHAVRPMLFLQSDRHYFVRAKNTATGEVQEVEVHLGTRDGITLKLVFYK